MDTMQAALGGTKEEYTYIQLSHAPWPPTGWEFIMIQHGLYRCKALELLKLQWPLLRDRIKVCLHDVRFKTGLWRGNGKMVKYEAPDFVPPQRH